MNICLTFEPDAEKSVVETAQRWSQYLKVPLNPANPQDFQFILNCSSQGLLLLDEQGRKLRIDFDENHLDYKRKHRGKNELLAKALGASKGVKSVLDLSVGMGIDSVFLAQLGFQVTGVERSPVLFALLSEALARTQQQPGLVSYQLHHADSYDFLTSHRGQMAVDAIYFDPMYPHKKKTALPKQEMLVFRELVGHDEDAARVLQAALQWPCQRVVVKRPLQAEPLLPGMSHSFEGKIVRYDMYIVRSS